MDCFAENEDQRKEDQRSRTCSFESFEKFSMTEESISWKVQSNGTSSEKCTTDKFESNSFLEQTKRVPYRKTSELVFF